MNIYSFDGNDLKMMLIGSVNLLAESRAKIDALNVFPVPDGDTGTNMYLTLLAGVKEAQQVEGNKVGEVAEAAARGCLYGARGNSGVILSQIMKGVAQALKGQTDAVAADVVRAFISASEAADRAVNKPVEGTILTVCRETARAIEEMSRRHSDLLRITLFAYKKAKLVLDRTPEQLPVLKQAGVVDAGGQGFVMVIYGIIRALKDAAARRDIQLFDLATSQQKEFVASWQVDMGTGIEYTYCTEFIVTGNQIPTDTLRSELSPYGDCLLVVGDNMVTKVHIHSNHPGLVLECALKYGALQSVQISNMEEQNREFRTHTRQDEKNTGIVAVAMGEGIATVLEGMGVDKVINGGQTMNPSAEEILQALEALPHNEIIILPNNKNIILAAEQAAKMSSKNVIVMPSTSIPEAIAALMNYNPLGTAEENAEKMKDSNQMVLTGEVTQAVRDSRVNGLEVTEGQFIGLAGGQLAVSGEQLEDVTTRLVVELIGDEGELVTLFYGAGLSGREARAVLHKLEKKLPGIEFELYYGGQPLYHFIISVE